MVVIHWVLCLSIAYVGFLRCIEMDGTHSFMARLVTSGTPPTALLMAFKPEALGLSFGGWSLIILTIMLLGVLAELDRVQSWIRSVFVRITTSG